jgi:hypothetical protein
MIIFSTVDGKTDGPGNTLDDLGRALETSPKLLLHFHGGLIDDAAGRGIAERLSHNRPGLGAGFTLDAYWNQAYLVWHTGAFETLKTNWLHLLRDDRLYNVVLKKLLSFVAGKLGIPSEDGRAAISALNLSEDEIVRRMKGNGDQRAPFADVDIKIDRETSDGRGPVIPIQSDARLSQLFQEQLVKDPEFNRAVAEIDSAANADAIGRGPMPPADLAKAKAAYERLSANVRKPIEDAKPREPDGRFSAVSVGAFLLEHAGKIAYRAFKRFRSQRDHGFHATLVEELARELYGDLIGAKVWGEMVQDAADHFAPGGFGTALLAKLEAQPNLKLVITAHSAGSIVVAQLLNAIHTSGAKLSFDLVLLAPAVRLDLFASAIEAAGDHVKSCRMYTMDDLSERRDPVLGEKFGFVYPSSLLYAVSGLFEEADNDAFVDAPILGMQRFVDAGWLTGDDQIAAAKTVSTFFKNLGHSIVYSPLANVTEAKGHGEFDSKPIILKTVSDFIAALP